MQKLAKRAFAADIVSALCLCAAMIYFFMYSVIIIPALAATYAGNTGSAAGNAVAAFGVALGAGVVAAIFAVIAAAGILLGIYALVAAFACRKSLLQNNRLTAPCAAAGTIATLAHVAALTGALILYTYPVFIPVPALAAVGLAISVGGWVYKIIALNKLRHPAASL